LTPKRLASPNSLAHDHRIGGVEAAGDIGDGDEGHDALVVAHLVEAKGLAHVAIDVPCHDGVSQSRASSRPARCKSEADGSAPLQALGRRNDLGAV
jgi:hypothetical protein